MSFQLKQKKSKLPPVEQLVSAVLSKQEIEIKANGHFARTPGRMPYALLGQVCKQPIARWEFAQFLQQVGAEKEDRDRVYDAQLSSYAFKLIIQNWPAAITEQSI